jgi:hypothetical protein
VATVAQSPRQAIDDALDPAIESWRDLYLRVGREKNAHQRIASM